MITASSRTIHIPARFSILPTTNSGPNLIITPARMPNATTHTGRRPSPMARSLTSDADSAMKDRAKAAKATLRARRRSARGIDAKRPKGAVTNSSVEEPVLAAAAAIAANDDAAGTMEMSLPGYGNLKVEDNGDRQTMEIPGMGKVEITKDGDTVKIEGENFNAEVKDPEAAE